MAFCKKCGTELAEGAPACQACGEPTAAQAQAYAAPMSAQQDAAENKVNGVLAYLGILVLVPIFSEKGKRSPFARYHANQGLILLIVDVALSIIGSIIGAIFAPSPLEQLAAAMGAGVVSPVPTIVWLIISVIILALSIMGIVNAVKGVMKPLPVIGGFKLLK